MKLKKKRRGTGLSRVRNYDAPQLDLELPEYSDGIEKNAYYMTVSRRYRTARFATLMLLILFMLIMMTVRREDITLSNLQYLLRDINLSSGSGEAFSGVSYAAEPIQRFAVYRGELLYVTGRETKLFSATGGTGLSATISYEEPAISASDRYILVYDVGGYGYSIYNSFSELLRSSSQYPIIAADMAGTGDFVIVSGSRERRATVTIYNGDFDKRSVIHKTDYVSGASLSEDGAVLAMTSFGVSGGSYYFDVSFYRVGEDATYSTSHITGEYPLSVGRIGGGFYVITTESVYTYNMDGSQRGHYVHGGGLGKYSGSDSYLLLAIPTDTLGTENRIVILDADANVCYNAVIEEKLVDAEVSGHGEAFLLSQGHAVMIDIAAGTEKTCTVGTGARRLIPTGSKTALLCLSSSAETIDFAHLSP